MSVNTNAHTKMLATVQPRELTIKQENFAQRLAANGNAARAYREAFDCAHMKPSSIKQKGYELAHVPAVAARVRELQATAAEGTMVDVRARMVRVQLIAEADPSEVAGIYAEPCRGCWSDKAIVLAFQSGNDPDLNEPQPDCPECRGHGARRVVLTPTDELSPSARALLKSVRQRRDGSIEVHLHDQLAASDQLNRMQSVYVEKSVSLTATVNVPALDKMSRDEQLAFLNTLRPTL